MSASEDTDEPRWRAMVHEAWWSIEPAVFRAMVASNRQYVSDLLETL